jgi:magnesium-transporting ATPase (P-type)
MGIIGTRLPRSGDIFFYDDNFGSIISAVEEGRSNL